MEVLTAQLKEQAAQIQKVSAHLARGKPAAKVVVNKLKPANQNGLACLAPGLVEIGKVFALAANAFTVSGP